MHACICMYRVYTLHTTHTAVLWVGFNQYSIKHANGSETQMRKVRSKDQWFTSSCNSHQLSHFTAFFIKLGAKTSIAKDRITWFVGMYAHIAALLLARQATSSNMNMNIHVKVVVRPMNHISSLQQRSTKHGNTFRLVASRLIAIRTVCLYWLMQHMCDTYHGCLHSYTNYQKWGPPHIYLQQRSTTWQHV